LESAGVGLVASLVAELGCRRDAVHATSVSDRVGSSDEARVVFNCDNKPSAIELQSLLLGRVVGASVEATI
jgi:hypothetical protein